MELHFGVVDVAYSSPDAKGATTTGDVAEILEDKYHVMRTFYELHDVEIAEAVVNVLAGDLENMLQGAEGIMGADVSTRLGSISLTGSGSGGRIEEMFRDYLDAREWKYASGQTVEAAEAGISHRKKKKKYQTSRPEFVDTGLYQASFRAWIET